MLVFRLLCDEVTARHDLKVIRTISNHQLLSEFIDLATIVYERLLHRSWATTLPQIGSVASLFLKMERACHLFRRTSSLLVILLRFPSRFSSISRKLFLFLVFSYIGSVLYWVGN